jgi:prepilin-type N-terminal cleavage/methylation domain-containing protein
MKSKTYKKTVPKELRGFTLIEIMIVIVIISIIAAIAIPSLFAAMRTAHEASAIGTLKTITSANVTYKSRYKTYAASLADLGAVGLVDPVVASASKNEYDLFYNGGKKTYTCYAVPQTPDSGSRSFFLDETAMIRYAEGSQTSGGTGWTQIPE